MDMVIERKLPYKYKEWADVSSAEALEEGRLEDAGFYESLANNLEEDSEQTLDKLSRYDKAMGREEDAWFEYFCQMEHGRDVGLETGKFE